MRGETTMQERKYTLNAADYIWVRVKSEKHTYNCLWAMKHYYRAANPVYVGDQVHKQL